MRKSTFLSSRTIVVSVLVVAILLIAATAVYGTLYSINTEDFSVAEWAAQSIPVFQTDVSDSHVTDARDDIVRAWVASDTDDRLAFKMEVSDPSSALSAGSIGAVAIIDCNANDIDTEEDDRLVIYNRAGTMIISEGNLGSFFYGNSDDGQIVGNQVEWAIPLNDLPPLDGSSIVDCQNDIKIRFATADTLTNAVIDETSPLESWNVPNDVSLLALEASDDSRLPMLTVAAAMLLIGVTLIIFRFRRA